MKEITLSRGKVALVDDEDFASVTQFKWYAWKHPKHEKYYACRTVRLASGKRAMIKMHCFILGMIGVDHEDRDGLNNQRHNLRPANKRQNAANVPKLSRPNRPSTSKYKGVSKRKGSNLWRAQLWDTRPVYIGYFVHELDAAKAYDVEAYKRWGEFAFLNFPITK